MKKPGITLIELLITITLMGSLLIAISSLYLIGFRTYTEELASSMVQSNAQTIMDAVILDAKNGMLIPETYHSDTTGKDYTTDVNMVIIRIPAINASNQILYSGTDELYDTVIYYYSNNEIHKVTYADLPSARHSKDGLDTVLDKQILSLNFVYDPVDPGAAHLVKVTISSDIMVGNRNKEITITGEARMRNHI